MSYSAGAPITRPKEIRLIRCYAVRTQHHLSLSRLRGRTKKIGHPNGVPDPSLQINYIVDDLVPQSFLVAALTPHGVLLVAVLFKFVSITTVNRIVFVHCQWRRCKHIRCLHLDDEAGRSNIFLFHNMFCFNIDKLFHEHLLSVDDIDALLQMVETLTREVIDFSLTVVAIQQRVDACCFTFAIQIESRNCG